MVKQAMLPILILAAVATVSAQSPVPIERLECGGFTGPAAQGKSELSFDRRDFAIQDGGFCSQYSWAGWERTMDLYLGEGADRRWAEIEGAVDLWNEALRGFNQRPVIRIVDYQLPSNASLSSDFWRKRKTESTRLLGDGQSVIYFKGGAPRDSTLGGFARLQTDSRDRMIEADIYINVSAEERLNGGSIVQTQKIMASTEEGMGVYAMVGTTYLAIIHELGHALGLAHVPVSGNIMSYNYMPRMRERWEPAMFALLMSFGLLGDLVGEDVFVTYRDDAMSQYMTVWPNDDDLTFILADYYTESVTLGEQDKMALMCIYDFTDWNH